MAKVLVTYFSQTGNTEKVAQAIYEEIEESKTIKPVEELDEEEVEKYKLVFIGFPVHGHSVPYIMEKFLRSLPAGKKIALFSTHGSVSGSPFSREALEHAAVLASKNKVLGSFSCRGKVSLQAIDKFEKSPEHRIWTEMAPSAGTHPDKTDLEEARSFAREIINLASY